jgi:sugar phosphate isomerase/epimerase
VPQVKIAIQLAGLRLPFRKALPVAARLGATGVEIDARGEIKPQDMTGTALRELRRMFEEFSLKVVAVSFHTRRGYDVAESLEERVAATKAAMKFAADLRAPVVVNQIGRVPAEAGGPAWQQLLESLADLGAYGHHVGAQLVAQTGSESGPDLKRLIDALPPEAIGVDLDPGKLIINGFSANEAVQSLGSHIRHVHARDGVRDLARGRGLEVPLGRGSADFAGLLGALEERQYRGYFTIAREDAENPEFEIGEAVKYLRSL